MDSISMVPVNSVSIDYADAVSPGDLVYIHETKRYALIVEDDIFVAQVVLDCEQNFGLRETKRNEGLATIIDDWQIEVDHRSLVNPDRLANKHLLLTVSGERLGVMVEKNKADGFRNFVFTEGKRGKILACYASWRVVLHKSDDRDILFCRSIDAADGKAQ